MSRLTSKFGRSDCGSCGATGERGAALGWRSSSNTFTLRCIASTSNCLFFISISLMQRVSRSSSVYLISTDPFAVPLAVPLSVSVCFLPPHPILHPHPLECPSLCQCPPSLSSSAFSPTSTSALSIPLYVSLTFLFTGAQKAAISHPHFMMTTSRSIHLISQVMIPPYLTREDTVDYFTQ